MTKGRYILLAGTHHTARGWEDFRGTFNTIEEAKSFAEKGVQDVFLAHQWAQVIDKDNMKLVCECFDFIPRVGSLCVFQIEWEYNKETKDD